jgi:hypothetical protein
MPIASMHVFGWGKRYYGRHHRWISVMVHQCLAAIFLASTFILSTFNNGLFPMTIDALDLIWDI